MLIIRTKHDPQTSYLFAWSSSIIGEAEKRGFRVTKVEGPDINLKNLEKRIKKVKPRFIFFNGHGNKYALFNNSKREVLNLDSAHVFRDTITFARACDCLVNLGAKAVKEGCSVFIGYKNKFWCARQHGMESRPLKDPIAKPIFGISNEVARQLLKGKNAREAVDKSHKKADEVIMELIYSKEPFASAALGPIIYNDAALDFKGDASAKI